MAVILENTNGSNNCSPKLKNKFFGGQCWEQIVKNNKK